MKAKDVMSKPVLATTPRASARDIATQMVVNRLSGMPVAELDGKVISVISETDVLKALGEGKKLETLMAQDIMSDSAVTVDLEATTDEVIKLMQEHHILRVPVTEHGKLAGIISRSDLIKAVLEPEFITFA